MSKRIMVVEDSDDVRLTTCFILRQAGYEVIEATDGEDALSKLESEPVDLVLTDLDMPNIDGLGVTRGVRAHPAHASVPVVIVTGVPGQPRTEEGKLAGVSAWLFKPFKPDLLLALIAQVLP